MTITPKLGLKMPGLDDPALVTDLNDNMVILDNAITASGVATLTNKTLDAAVLNNPVVNGWASANHAHLDLAGGGPLDGAAIVTGASGTGLLLRETALTAGNIPILDPIVRDTIQWGAKPAGAVDTTLLRTAAGALRLNNL